MELKLVALALVPAVSSSDALVVAADEATSAVLAPSISRS